MEGAKTIREKAQQCRRLAGFLHEKDAAVETLLALADEFDAKAAAFEQLKGDGAPEQS